VPNETSGANARDRHQMEKRRLAERKFFDESQQRSDS
jgi:hypothetical protein